jgi:hypothetical protein
MGKLGRESRSKNGRNGHQRLARLRSERRTVAARLARLDEEILQLKDSSRSDKAFEQWLGDLSDGLPELPPLPLDWNRADLYDDHD